MEQLIKDVRYYIDLRVKKLKLDMIENLSLIFSRMAVFVVVILLGFVSLLLFSGALTALIYRWTGSLVYAFTITGAFFSLVAVITYLLRKNLFRNAMIGILSNAFFKKRVSKYDDDEEEDYE